MPEPFVDVIVWCFLSGFLLLIANVLAQHAPQNTVLWWTILFLTLVPFITLPVVFTQVMSIPEVLLLGEFQSAFTQVGTVFPTGDNGALYTSRAMIILVLAYLFVFTLKLTRFCKQYCALCRLCQSATETQRLGFKVYQLPLNCSPFVSGLLRPRIYVPQQFFDFPQTEQQVLLCHELSHIQNRDHISVLVWRLITIVCWFNPFIRKMEKGFVKAMEYRCDLNTIKSHNISPVQYARALLNGFKLASTPSANVVSCFTAGQFDARDNKRRLQLILQPQKSMGALLLSAIIAALFTSLTWANTLFDESIVQETDGEIRWTYPLADLNVTSPYGHVSRLRNYRKHGGVDFGVPEGTPVTPVAEGVVTIADNSTLSSKYGNVILVEHSNGYQSLYAHLNEIRVKPGMKVYKGQTIGSVGATGMATGPHLHLEILNNERRIDLLTVLD
ncbi:M23/M56 family metallopeptidase [Planctobacterium marinum]|uniref:Uncharacterized protein n=1 Tax=Planctobacterium marinum TaxID=1631968 RepID=A0AA48HN79_9ALTE|nr:hypothetical protein MACH26_11280 [Planctobacterium marinum]